MRRRGHQGMESRALCILERLVHLVRLPHDEAFTRIQIPDSVSSHTLLLVPSERCLVLNPQHPEFPRIRFDPPVLFKYDHRLIRER